MVMLEVHHVIVESLTSQHEVEFDAGCTALAAYAELSSLVAFLMFWSAEEREIDR